MGAGWGSQIWPGVVVLEGLKKHFFFFFNPEFELGGAAARSSLE